MSPSDTALVVIDVQDKLIRHIPDHQRLVWNIRRLLDAASTLEVRVTGTEQYPQGLGPTVPELAERIGEVPAKMTFSCVGCPGLFAALADKGIHKLLLAGIETHVCVQQTALDALANGFQVYLAVDASGSRHDQDREVALRRMELAGACLTTTEAAMFEWCQTAGTPEFKQISLLVREKPPSC